jgi:hypothetical protein
MEYDQARRRLIEDRINIQKTGIDHDPFKDSIMHNASRFDGLRARQREKGWEYREDQAHLPETRDHPGHPHWTAFPGSIPRHDGQH